MLYGFGATEIATATATASPWQALGTQITNALTELASAGKSVLNDKLAEEIYGSPSGNVATAGGVVKVWKDSAGRLFTVDNQLQPKYITTDAASAAAVNAIPTATGAQAAGYEKYLPWALVGLGALLIFVVARK